MGEGDASGWAQFFGSLIGIVVAWRLAKSQQNAAMHAAEHERRLEGYAIAVVMRPQLERLIAALEGFEFINGSYKDKQPGAAISRVGLDTFSIPIPVALEENRYSLYKLGGNAAILAHRLYGEMLRYNEFTTNNSISFARAEAFGIYGTEQEYVPATDMDVTLALKLCRGLRTELDRIIAAVPEASQNNAIWRWLKY